MSGRTREFEGLIKISEELHEYPVVPKHPPVFKLECFEARDFNDLQRIVDTKQIQPCDVINIEYHDSVYHMYVWIKE